MGWAPRRELQTDSQTKGPKWGLVWERRGRPGRGSLCLQTNQPERPVPGGVPTCSGAGESLAQYGRGREGARELDSSARPHPSPSPLCPSQAVSQAACFPGAAHPNPALSIPASPALAPNLSNILANWSETHQDRVRGSTHPGKGQLSSGLSPGCIHSCFPSGRLYESPLGPHLTGRGGCGYPVECDITASDCFMLHLHTSTLTSKGSGSCQEWPLYRGQWRMHAAPGHLLRNSTLPLWAA